MANYFVPNPAGIAETLYGPSGPVYRHINDFGQRVQGYAKAHAPVDTGALRADIRATAPVRGPSSLNLRVGSDVRHPGEEWSYARVAHQGHRALPVQRKGALMRFLPKGARGTRRYVYTYRVRAVAGRRYLTLGVIDINNTLPADVQFRLELIERLVS